jgi:hypothetical protein
MDPNEPFPQRDTTRLQLSMRYLPTTHFSQALQRLHRVAMRGF